MAITETIYNKAIGSFTNKEIDWVDGDIKLMLCTNAYTQ